MFNKKYDKWISKEFGGLSAHTLFQILLNYLPKYLADEWVYYNLFNYFCGIHSNENTKCYQATYEYINLYWLED